MFYFCLWVINKKKELEYCPVKTEKSRIFEEYVKYVESLKINKDAMFELKKVAISDEKLKEEFKDFSF